MDKSRLIIVALLTIFVLTQSASDMEAKVKDPILLVHGLASGPESWGNLPGMLEDELNTNVYVFNFEDYADEDYANNNDYSPLERVAAAIASKIKKVKDSTGSDKVSIVAHSIGGLAVAAYLADYGVNVKSTCYYKDDISKIIFVDVPFFGFNEDILSEEDFDVLLLDTEWSVFLKNRRWFINRTLGLTRDLWRLYWDCVENTDENDINMVTVFSSNDGIVEHFSANIMTAGLNPFSKSDWHEFQLPNVDIRGYSHADHELIPGGKHAVINVDKNDHELYAISSSFLGGGNDWKNKDVNLPEEKYACVIFDVNTTKIDRDDISRSNIRLWAVKNGKDNKRLNTIEWLEDQNLGILFVEDSGDYKIFLASSRNQKSYFYLTLHAGGSHVGILNDSSSFFRPMPASVYSYNTLVKAAYAIIGADELDSPTDFAGLIDICIRIRDALVSYYDEWEVVTRGDGYIRPDRIKKEGANAQILDYDFFYHRALRNPVPRTHLMWYLQ